MIRLIQTVLALAVCVLAFGLFGRWGISGGGTVDVAIVAVWLFAWLGTRDAAVVFAITLGIFFDFLSFLPFGYWIMMFVAMSLIIDWLKNSYLTISSFYQAIVVLLLVTFLSSFTTSIWLGTTNLLQIMTTALLNLAVGAVVYYLLAIRLKMFQRWTGKRL